MKRRNDEGQGERQFRKEDGVPVAPPRSRNTFDFDDDGWVAMLRSDGTMQIVGRSTRGRQLALFDVVKLTVDPGEPAVAENSEGEQFLLLTSALH